MIMKLNRGASAMRKHNGRALLSVGTNLSLLGLRNAVFTQAGYNVITARSAAQAAKLINSTSLSAVVVGHSLNWALQERVVAEAKKRALPAVVLHEHPFSRPVVLADANLCGIDGAATVTDLLGQLLGSNGETTIHARRNEGRR